MGVRKTSLLWTASLAAIAAGGLSACERAQTGAEPSASSQSVETAAVPAPEINGEGGEAGESGGEFGIDAALAERDPVIFLSAIEVMRAHYLAGLAALGAGERAAASEMFSHPVSEIYIDFEPALEARGGVVMLEEMNRAAVLHFQGASADEIRAAVAVVLDHLDANEAVAPVGDMTRAQVDALVLIDLGQRAALQYAFIQGDGAAGEAWLDAYGFNAAAQAYADTRLSAIGAENAPLAASLDGMLTTMGAALSQFEGPASDAPAPDALTRSVEAARAALQGA
jgi:hypothetical protein